MRLTPGAFVLSVLALGCGSVSPNGNGHMDGGGGTGSGGTSGSAGTAGGGGAAGSAGTGGGDTTSPFVGAWKYTTGSIDQMCNLAGIPAVDLTGDAMTIVKVDDTHIKADWAATDVMCSIEYTVAGTIATSVPGQTCTEMIPVTIGGTAMTIAMNIDITRSTLTVTGGEVAMALNGTASAEGGLVSCTPTGTGTATSSSGGAAGHGG